jgi:hypothetical protein
MTAPGVAMETKMNHAGCGLPIRYLTVANSTEDMRQATLLLESLRRFGGEPGQCPVWLFSTRMDLAGDFSGLGELTLLPLEIDPAYRSYPIADKVAACAQAEAMAGAEVCALVWLNLDCLVINPPELFELGTDYDAAFRPVHIQNVGSPASQPLDGYWQTVYQAVGIDDSPYAVESFVDAQTIRPYYNTHCFSINPARGVLQAWRDIFAALVLDKEFQARFCADDRHQIFLHQVVLSALLVKSIEFKRLRVLTPDYSYPLHLQAKLPVAKRAQSLNRVVCMVYEDTTLLNQIEIQEPMLSWLRLHRPATP